MNVNNFSSLDFSNMLNRRQNDWNQTMDSVGGLGKAFGDYYDRKLAEDERKRKWDSILEIEKMGNEAMDADDRYNESVARQDELRRNIETANGMNERRRGIEAEYQKALGGQRRYMDSVRRGATMPEGAEYVNNGGVEGYNVDMGNGNKVFAPMEGVENGEYRDYGFGGGRGEWGRAVMDPYEDRVARLSRELEENPEVNVDALKWKLGEEENRSVGYRKAGENADMYRDPRYRAALAAAKADGNPEALNRYINQWSSEYPQRQSEKTMNAIRNMPIDVSEYGPTARMLREAISNAQTPEEQRAYMSMLYGVMSQVDQQRMADERESRERSKENRFALAMRDYNNKDWSLADLGGRLRNIDINGLSSNEIVSLQKELGVKPTGRKDNATIDAIQRAIAANDELNEYENNLFNDYDASRVIGAINDSKRQKQLEELLKGNKVTATRKPKSGWVR